MKSKQLVLIAIALLCGLVSAIGIIQAMGNKGEVAEKIPMGPVLVASADVDLKAELTEENVRLENWPLNLIPEGAATDLGEVDGMYILTRLRSGQAIILEDVKPESELMIKNIPAGHKVINLKVPAEDFSLLEPGDRVDIIGHFHIRNGGEQKSETKTFLKGIRIFNIGTSTSAQDKNKSASASGIVGVLVTERQSEKIVWARKNGEIRLALVGEGDAESFEDPDFPMGDDPEVAQPETQLPDLAGMFTPKKPTIDMSKLRQVKVFAGGKTHVTYFDEQGNQVKLQPDEDTLGAPTGMPMVPTGARGLPPVDYEGFDGSAELPNGIEEDQYRGE